MANPSRLSDLSRELVSASPDSAGRVIAGLLGYNPGPGIYSRLERAIEAMPANVRVQEIPGLIKRYKEGVPGWELREVDLDSVIAGRDVVPRDELLAQVKERSPVYTHKEVVLGGTPPTRPAAPDGSEGDYDVPVAVRQGAPSPISGGISHGMPRFEKYGQGGQDYTELLLTQPGAERLLAPPDAGTDPEFQVAPRVNYGSHWSDDTKDAVAHARFDTHGDALRINELQSDLGIHNRKAREAMADFVEGQPIATQRPAPEIPFPLEDTWADLLIKRLALEAARKGHRAIEVASPRAIADKVGGNIDNYEHFYGKVVPGALERLGRKMGGLTGVKPPASSAPTQGYAGVLDEMRDGPPDEGQPVLRDALAAMRMLKAHVPKGPLPAFGESSQSAWNSLAGAYRRHSDVGYEANRLHDALSADMSRGGGDSSKAAELMPQLIRLAETHAASLDAYERVDELARLQDFQRGEKPAGEAARRYIMSDEMRRRLIEQGVGASVLAPLLMTGEER